MFARLIPALLLALAMTGLWTLPGYASPIPVTLQVIDGTGDGNTTVTVLAGEVGAGRLVYLAGDASEWKVFRFIFPKTFAGGTVIQFGLDTDWSRGEPVEPEVLNAELTFLSLIEASYSQNPVVGEPYYGVVLMEWGYGTISLGVAGTTYGKDGFRLVPIPGSAWVLGGLCLAFLGVGRRRGKFSNALILVPRFTFRGVVLIRRAFANL
jgi:hypothetical protein